MSEITHAHQAKKETKACNCASDNEERLEARRAYIRDICNVPILRRILGPAHCKPGDEHGKKCGEPHEGSKYWYPDIYPVVEAERNVKRHATVGCVDGIPWEAFSFAR